MNVFFIRHGETDWNKLGKIQGGVDNPLNQKGREEATKLAAALKDVRYDRAYSSPLLRARETAGYVTGECGDRVICDERLREMSFGECEGMSLAQINADPQSNLYQFFHHPDEYVPAAGGETIEALCGRCQSFLDSLAVAENECDNVFVFSHGALIRGILSVVEKLPPKQFWSGTVLKNCAVIILECQNGHWRVAADARELI